jgi:hypothetical protein
MKRTFLLMVGPALLVAMAFAQTPAASTNPDQTMKGCLAGSDGNYTVAEDGTGHIFKVTAGSVDFKQHVGHDVTLIGHRASAANPDVADNTFAVTELNMISEHCAVAAAVPTATVTTPADNAVPPPAAAAPTSNTVAETEVVPAADAAPAAPAAPVATVITPAETSVPPTVDATPPAETNIAPAVDAAAPAAPASTQAWDKSAADAADQAIPVHSRRRSATTAAVATAPAVTASESAETASEPAAAAASPAATASTPSPTAATPDAADATPAAPAKHATALVLLIGFALLVILIGIMVPSLSRWRKRRSLEQSGAPNLSFTRETSSDQNDQKKTDTEEPRRVA